jgi:hypothetical protein
MQMEDLLVYKSDSYSQGGDDGIIAAIFDRIGTTTKACCEFGAWDGIHLSNCRNLILLGWSALMIESDEHRFKDLVSNYATNPLVTCVNRLVDAELNSLGSILKASNIGNLDFLSIDIDGLDFEIFETLDVYPRVICIEVNAGHNPKSETRLRRDIAQNNVGQPLQVFVRIADVRGYDLVCYTGNAFFVRRDIIRKSSLSVLSSEQAYQHFLNHLPKPAKEWLYLVNLGITTPFFQYDNAYLNRNALGIGKLRAIWLKSKQIIIEGGQSVAHRLRKIARG